MALSLILTISTKDPNRRDNDITEIKPKLTMRKILGYPC